MKPTTLSRVRGLLARYSDWWTLLLVLALLVSVWVGLFKRSADDDARDVREAFVNHGNIAHAVANHTSQLLERLRFYSLTLSGSTPDQSARLMVGSGLKQDKSFLRLMHFNAEGQLLFSTGRKPEPWLQHAARDFATKRRQGPAEEIVIGMVPQQEHAHAWSLPIIYRPAVAEDPQASFILALIDVGDFPRRFEEVMLGKSGEIVLVANDGRELLHMHEGRLDPLESIAGSRRLQLAFERNAGVVAEKLISTHERLYAYRRVAASPLAVLVSRTRYDVVLENKVTQRGYWGSALLLSAVMVFLTLLWMVAARRRRLLIRSLTLAQEKNMLLIKQVEKEKEVAYRLATYDQLTGLPNRLLFADLASRYAVRALRIRARFAVLFIDLDRFKPINDMYGHKTGDQLLIEVSLRLQDCMRQTDVVSRYGGDEFVALVSDLRSSQDAALIAEKIINSLSQAFVGLVDADIKVTPSIGIAFYPDDADVIETLVRQADAAMYVAKGRGRATFAFADPSLNRRIELRNQIEASLPSAFLNREIQVHYQPKVLLRDFAITGMEALARWNHPQLGAISPADFIPVAEESGAIIELGEYVIVEVCRQLALWTRSGVPLVPVAVNVSSRQLRSPKLYEFIVNTLEHYGIAPQLLEIEITETGLIDAEGFIDTLRRLDAIGIRLAIDDFGTGYSGLSHLRALPVSYLKIDRCFIKDIRNDTNDAAIVSNTISLSHNLKLLTIAEGVETPEQVAHLKAARCDQAQGYFFSRPCAAEALESLLRQKYIYVNMNERP